MIDVLTGFAIIFVVIGAGYVLAQRGIIGAGDQRLMFNRVAYWAASPALLFTTVATSDAATFISPVVVVVFIATAITMVVFWVISRLFFQADVPTRMAGAASASYFNSVNIGLPIAIYVIGDAAYMPPVLLMQMVIVSPIVIAGLTADPTSPGSRGRNVWEAVKSGLTAPVVVAPLLGLVFASMEWTLPDPVMAPLEILAGASIPMILMSFGASLRGGAVLSPGPDRPATITASILKLMVMPAIAWVIGALAGLEGSALYAAVILSALPTAQNVYNYTANFRAGETVARDTVFITTFLSLPAMVVIALLFGNGI